MNNTTRQEGNQQKPAVPERPRGGTLGRYNNHNYANYSSYTSSGLGSSPNKDYNSPSSSYNDPFKRPAGPTRPATKTYDTGSLNERTGSGSNLHSLAQQAASNVPPPPPPSTGTPDGKKNSLKVKSGKNTQKLKNIQISAPLPEEFLRDPNGKIFIIEVDGWFTVTFDYNAILRSSEWSKPDKEGEVMKEGFYMKKNMKPRYCILQGHKLFFFKQKPKPETDEEEANLMIDLRNGVVQPQGMHNKLYCFEIIEADQTLGKKVILGVKSRAEYESWIERIQGGITYEGPAVEITRAMKQSITVQHTPEFGYVGLPIEWKQSFRDHAITEKEFFERPEEVIKQLRFNKSSTPIVNHQANFAPVTIDDVINKKGSPDMYIGYQLLGSGSFGEVYEAIDITTNKKVAIKKMLVTPRRLKLFISEINIQRSTEHPNVVKFLDAFPVDTHIWVVLEYMPNGNLTQVLDAMKEQKMLMTEPQIAYICTETLKALSYIHSLHRIHRDIKSDNVLIGGGGEIKLADFGYAVQLSAEAEKRQTVCGSPYWMAPEVILGQQYGKEVDIWSMGIMLMECCDLEPPYIMESPSKALVLISTKPVPPLKHPDKWSPELRQFRDLCLNRDAAKRPEAIELLMHPFLRRTCTGKELKESLLDRQKKKKEACVIQ